MRIERRITLNADRNTVWKVLGDPDRYPSMLPHLQRWETITEGPPRVGSRYTVLWKIGSIPVGGIAEVVEFDEARDLAWINITGVTQRGRFRLVHAATEGTARWVKSRETSTRSVNASTAVRVLRACS